MVTSGYEGDEVSTMMFGLAIVVYLSYVFFYLIIKMSEIGSAFHVFYCLDYYDMKGAQCYIVQI